jgi:hypothetical protein
MRKKELAIALIALIAVPSAFADWRVDIGAEAPLGMGVRSSDESVDYGVFLNLLFFLPQGTLSYDFSIGPLNLGVGVKAYTMVVESVAYPVVYAELDLDPVLINLTTGGLGFAVFGVYNNFFSGPLLIPDLSVMFKLGKYFRLGVGATTFLGTEDYYDYDYFPYLVYAAAKFSIPL